jgi:hypothetical protein
MPNIDWFFDHESEYFKGRLQKLVLQIHQLASEQLTAVYEAESEEAAREGSLDGHDLYRYREYLEQEHVSQQRALSTMALTMLASLTESFLDEARTRLDQELFPSAKKYSGDGVLLRRVKEYKDRFGIDLTILPGFDTVQEVVLARNSCVHHDGHPSDDYLKQTRHRFLEEVSVFDQLNRDFKNEERFIRCDSEMLQQVVEEISGFAMALHEALNACRNRTTSNRGSPPSLRQN